MGNKRRKWLPQKRVLKQRSCRATAAKTLKKQQNMRDNATEVFKRSQGQEDPNEQAEIKNNENNANGTETDDTEGKIQIVYCKTEPEEPDFQKEIEDREVNYKEKEVQEIHETDTSEIVSTSSNNSNLLRKRKFSEIDYEINDYNEKEIFFNLCDSYLTGELAELVKTQMKHLNFFNTNTESSLHKKHKSYIAFCWNLYLTSPQVYFLKVLGLPAPNVLKDSMSISTETDETVISVLESKVKNMTDLEKNCALVMYTVDLRAELFYNIKEDRIIGFHEVDGVQTAAAAKNALVIALRGIFVDWKQPIAYALLSECPDMNKIDDWIMNVLTKLIDIELNVRSFVSDFEPEFYDSAKRRQVTIDKPYFIIKNKVIYYIYDAAHLIKEVHNNFIQYHYLFEGRVATYTPIIKFYNKDKKKSSRLAPHLTDDHIKPPKYQKSNAILFTQLLSSEVATGLSMTTAVSSKDTAEFIKNIHSLYEALRCSNQEDCEQKRPFLDGMLLFLQHLKVIRPTTGNDITYTVKFIKKFQITIMSVLLLLDDLKSEGITCLPTKRLNLGIENEKTKNGETNPPTSKQFVGAFQKGFFTNIMKPTKGTNCDMGKVIASIMKLKELLNISNENQVSDKDEYSTIEIASHHYNKLEVPERHSIIWIASFLLRKCLEHHKHCEILKAYTNRLPNYDYTNNDRYKRYHNYTRDTESDLLVVTCDDFVEYINRLEETFRDSFEREHINRKIAFSIYQEIQDLNITPSPCPCFPTFFMKKLFIRMKICYAMKFMAIRDNF